MLLEVEDKHLSCFHPSTSHREQLATLSIVMFFFNLYFFILLTSTIVSGINYFVVIMWYVRQTSDKCCTY